MRFKLVLLGLLAMAFLAALIARPATGFLVSLGLPETRLTTILVEHTVFFSLFYGVLVLAYRSDTESRRLLQTWSAVFVLVALVALSSYARFKKSFGPTPAWLVVVNELDNALALNLGEVQVKVEPRSLTQLHRSFATPLTVETSIAKNGKLVERLEAPPHGKNDVIVYNVAGRGAVVLVDYTKFYQGFPLTLRDDPGPSMLRLTDLRVEPLTLVGADARYLAPGDPLPRTVDRSKVFRLERVNPKATDLRRAVYDKAAPEARGR